jgi:hypothetical protein
VDWTGTRWSVTWGSYRSGAADLTVQECYTVLTFRRKYVLPSSRSNNPRWVLLFAAVEGCMVLREVDRAQHPRYGEWGLWWGSWWGSWWGLWWGSWLGLWWGSWWGLCWGLWWGRVEVCDEVCNEVCGEVHDEVCDEFRDGVCDEVCDEVVMRFVMRLCFVRHVRKIAKKHYQLCHVCRPPVRPSLCLSVCLSVYMKQLGSHWMDSHENWYWIIFRKSIKKIQVTLKSYKNKGYRT